MKLNKYNLKSLKPFSEKELIERIQKSEQDYRQGKSMSQEDLEGVSSKW